MKRYFEPIYKNSRSVQEGLDGVYWLENNDHFFWHFTPRKYWLITQEAMAPSRHDWKIVDWDVKPQHNQPFLILIRE